MPSFVWNRDPAEAYQEPYEYGGQEQFSREAKSVLKELRAIYKLKDRAYTRNERSREKAIWMLQVDALEALTDSLRLIDEKRHRIASRLFRDAMETMDCSFYFSYESENFEADLAKWYADEVLPHRVFRNFFKKQNGDTHFENLRSLYGELSRYTHRSYRALLMSYILAANDEIAYDGFRLTETGTVTPHVIAFQYALLAMLIKRFVEISVASGQTSTSAVEGIWAKCLEEETVPRRFGFGPGQLMRGPPIPIS
jgi:hypothetical protein